ncbi:MAG: STAS domain-containing protein [Candidatus Riflebacteria bacterium]|nr:STAS domain-containing protein [Candidatus Riflebacteria bacterium]
MSRILDISVTQEGESTILVKLYGELDQMSLKDLRNELSARSAEKVDLLIFDLEEVDFIASAGLAIFAWYADCFKKRGLGQKLKVINCSEGVFRVFHLTMLDEMIDVSSSDKESA